MNASTDPSVVLPSSDGGSGKALRRRTTAKPQQCFADAAALVGIKEQTKPDKKTAGKVAVGIGPECEQGAPDTDNGSNQSVADNGQVVAGIGLPDQPAALLVPPKSDAAKADSALKPSPKDGGRTMADGVLKMTDGGLKTEDGGLTTENGGLKTADGAQKTADDGQSTEDGAQEESVSSASVGCASPTAFIGPADKNTVSRQRKDGASSQAEPPVSSVGQPAIVTPRPSFQTQIREVADVGTTQSPVRNVGEQILDSVRASVANGDKQVSIRLQPPELGMITVRLREQGEHIEGTLEVGRSDTRRQIEQALPEMVRSLQDAGVPIRRFDVTSSDPSGQDLGRGLPQQDAWSGQHSSGQNRDHAPASQASWSRGASEYPVDSDETSSSDRQIDPSRGRIDVLL